MTKISDTLVSTNYRANRDTNHPLLRHERALADGLDDLQYTLDDLQQGIIEADSISHKIAITYNVTTGAASIKIFDANAPFKFEVVDVIVQARATETNGKIAIEDGTNPITDAMICAVDTTIVRAATIDDSKSTIDVDGTLEIVCTGNTVENVKGLVTVVVVPRA